MGAYGYGYSSEEESLEGDSDEEPIDLQSSTYYAKNDRKSRRDQKPNSKPKLPYKAKRERPTGPPILRNALLYDTGSTDHIANSRHRFKTYTPNTS